MQQFEDDSENFSERILVEILEKGNGNFGQIINSKIIIIKINKTA